MRITLLLFGLLIPTVAAAEVSDKIPSIGFLLAEGILFGATAFALAWFHRWLVLLGVALATIMLWGAWDLWQEPYMRTALMNEQGMGYFVSATVSSVLVAGGAVGGLVLGKRRRPTRRSDGRPQGARPFWHH